MTELLGILLALYHWGLRVIAIDDVQRQRKYELLSSAERLLQKHRIITNPEHPDDCDKVAMVEKLIAAAILLGLLAVILHAIWRMVNV